MFVHEPSSRSLTDREPWLEAEPVRQSTEPELPACQGREPGRELKPSVQATEIVSNVTRAGTEPSGVEDHSKPEGLTRLDGSSKYFACEPSSRLSSHSKSGEFASRFVSRHSKFGEHGSGLEPVCEAVSEPETPLLEVSSVIRPEPEVWEMFDGSSSSKASGLEEYELD